MRRWARDFARPSAREPRCTRKLTVGKSAATTRRRREDRRIHSYRAVRRASIRPRIAVIDAATAAANDRDADYRADRLTDPAKTTAGGSATDSTSARLGRRGSRTNRRRTRRHGNVRRRVDGWGRRLGRRLRLRHLDLVVQRIVRRLRHLTFAHGSRTSDRFANSPLAHRRARGRRLDRGHESRPLIIADRRRELHARRRSRREIALQVRRQSGVLLGRLASPARDGNGRYGKHREFYELMHGSSSHRSGRLSGGLSRQTSRYIRYSAHAQCAPLVVGAITRSSDRSVHSDGQPAVRENGRGTR